MVEQVYPARAEDGAADGEMLPVKLYEDPTRRPSAFPAASWIKTPPMTGVTIHDDCASPFAGAAYAR